GEWISTDGLCWLGSTRLAILDLSSTGAQPMVDPVSGNVIVSNGEIYNHWELRAELGDLGWRGTSDTETILLGYRIWGRDLLPRLRGMFAFAIYDHARAQLFVARDRFGIKPLYYVAQEHSLRLGSEVKLLRRSGLRTTPGSVAAYLQWGASPEARLIYPEIKALPAGHALTIKRGGEYEFWRYWPSTGRFVPVPEPAPQKVRA